MWQASLKGITEQKIKDALNLLSKRGDEWPPSAPEFRKLCMHGQDLEEHRGEAYKVFKPAGLIEKKKAPKEFAQNHLKAFRESDKKLSREEEQELLKTLKGE